MSLRSLLFFLPDQALVLILIVLVLGAIVGIARPRHLLTFIVFLMLLPLLPVLFDIAFELMPFWMVMLVSLALLLYVFRMLAELLIGRTAADHMAGSLAASAVRCAFRLVFLPFRLLR